MKAYCVQLDIGWEERDLNHERTLELLDAVQPDPGSLIVLPEMFSTGFSMAVSNISDSPTGVTQAFLARAASRFESYVVGGVVTTATSGRGLNQAVVFDPQGREVARYAKMQPFTLGGESDHYEAGQEMDSFAWDSFKVAPFICYDLRFPELFRVAAASGANLYTVIANWPTRRINHWVTLLQARAIENQAFVVAVNRCGRDPLLDYAGRSMIIDPSGEVLIEAGDLECVVSCEIDSGTVTDYRRRLPFLRDMRSIDIGVTAGLKAGKVSGSTGEA